MLLAVLRASIPICCAGFSSNELLFQPPCPFPLSFPCQPAPLLLLSTRDFAPPITSPYLLYLFWAFSCASPRCTPSRFFLFLFPLLARGCAPCQFSEIDGGRSTENLFEPMSVAVSFEPTPGQLYSDFLTCFVPTPGGFSRPHFPGAPPLLRQYLPGFFGPGSFLYFSGPCPWPRQGDFPVNTRKEVTPLGPGRVVFFPWTRRGPCFPPTLSPLRGNGSRLFPFRLAV